MKKALIIVAVGMFLAMAASSAFAYEAFQGPTELHQYDPLKAYNGYTLFSPFLFGNASGVWTTYLIDMEGNLVHSWDFPTGPGLYAYFTQQGTILRGAQLPEAVAADTYHVLSGPQVGGLQEWTWDGTLLFDHAHYSEDSISHHDFRKIWNNALQDFTYIYLSFERMTAEDAVNLGADPAYEANYTGTGNKSGWSLCGIYEVDKDSNIIWKWSFADHLCQELYPDKDGYVTDVSAHPEKLDINWPTPYGGPIADWTHCNSLDYNQELDHIVLNAKHISTFFVVDHGATFVVDEAVPGTLAATDAGDFLYRFGNPSVYGQGDPPGYLTEGHQQMYGSHDIQWIGGANSAFTASELSSVGLGNFLIYDNGCWCPTGYHSEAIEINPYLDAQGNTSASYVNPPDAGYTSTAGGMMGAPFLLSNQVPWFFRSTMENSFYSSYISSVQRLPNGNTLVCSGATGHFFEVTADKKVVWEYINPVAGGMGAPPSAKKVQTDADGGMFFSVFRCLRYDADHPALAGKDLTPKGKLTEVEGYKALQDKLEVFMSQ
jgi:hypothetical protein